MQAPQRQYQGSRLGTPGSYVNQPPDVPQNLHHQNYSLPYQPPQPSYMNDVKPPLQHQQQQQYVPPYNGQQQVPCNSYRPPMNHDMYQSGQHYQPPNQHPYPNQWDRDNSQQNYAPPPQSQNGPLRNNQSQMLPPPHHHYAHHSQMSVPSPNQSPRPWSMPQQSPRATPSPMAIQNVASPSIATRSPVPSKSFSPSTNISSVNPSYEYQTNQPTNPSPCPVNASASPSIPTSQTLGDSNDPLQSLQKMVMIESQANESPIDRGSYDNMANPGLPNDSTQKYISEYSNVEVPQSEFLDSPGPTYFNLDEGRPVNKFPMEESSRGSLASDQGLPEPHFSTVPPMEHMNYPPVNGMHIEPTTYPQHPPPPPPPPHHHHNGYPPQMYQHPPEPYPMNNCMPPKARGKRGRKSDLLNGHMGSPARRRRKGRGTPENMNFYANGLPPWHANNIMPGMAPGPVDDMGIAPQIPRKRAYTKRAKTSKIAVAAPILNPNAPFIPGEVEMSNESSTDAMSSESILKKKLSPLEKLDEVAKPEILSADSESNIVNDPESPFAMSISSMDGPVKITRIPNIIGNDEKNEESDVSSTSRSSSYVKTHALKEVSVKIVPLSSRLTQGAIISDSNSKSENGFESVSNSPCSSNTGSMVTPIGDSIKDSTENDSNSNMESHDMLSNRKRGRPKKPCGEQSNANKQKKSRKPIEIPKPVEIVKRTDEKQRPLFGPYVHVEGLHDSPSSITIVNTLVKDEVKKDSKHKQKKGHKHVPAHNDNPRRKLGHTSTLSSNYDAVTKDKNWLCILCHKGSHCDNLGDLYGPYYHSSLVFASMSSACSTLVKTSVNGESDNVNVSPTQRTSNRLRRRKSSITEGSMASVLKNVKQGNNYNMKETANSNGSTPSTTPNQTPIKSETSDSLSTHEAHKNEYWVHEECILWANNVYIVGHKLTGLDDAIKMAVDTICSHCGDNGATIGCLAKNCPEQLHYLCATEKGCILNEENYTLNCPNHVVINFKQRS